VGALLGQDVLQDADNDGAILLGQGVDLVDV
jgi:hypothetical protein